MSASKIGPYEIKNTLRHDRQYAIFAAYDPRVREDVVLKLWRKEFTTIEFATRVRREAEIINSLNHPAIVPIWGFGDLGGNTYIATLEMTGGTLADRLKRGRLAASEVEALFPRLAQAVEALHERNIIHGHIQPQHILFNRKGEAHLAWVASSTLDPDYASPEQLNGQPATAASDVFSLGVLLLNLFTGKTLDTVTLEEIPQRYVNLLDRALYETPKDRFGSAREMLTAFHSPSKPLSTPDTGFDLAEWGATTTAAAGAGAAAAALAGDDDDPFAAWGMEPSPVTPQSMSSAAPPDDDPFADFDFGTSQPTPPPRTAEPDPDAELMALFTLDEEEEPVIPEAAPEPHRRPEPQRQFVYDPGDVQDEPFPNWLEDEDGSPGAEPLLPTLDQFLHTESGVPSEEVIEPEPAPKVRVKRRGLDPQTRRILLIGAAAILVILCLIPIIINLPTWLGPKPTPLAIVPTALPAPTDTPTPDPNAPTITPTPSPLIRIDEPINDSRIDMGTVVRLNITITDPIGLRNANVLANGQVIGSYTMNGELSYTIAQDWIPDQAGTKEIAVVATNRNGDLIESDPIRIRVIDQVMIELNQPIWDRVEANVIAIRDLEPLKPVEPNLVSRTELIQRYRSETFSQYTREDALRDVLVFYAFDFIERDYDLYRRYTQYLGENVAGYYDPATEEFVVVNRGEVLTPLGQLIYAHEFMHALQDQHFSLDLLTETTLTTDQNLALRGLAEGEATLVQDLYVAADLFTEEEAIEFFNESQIGATQDTSGRNIPRLLSDSFFFPYRVGRVFATYLYERGGWSAIDAAWANPPQSTEQIYHPERYVAGDVPQIVSVVPLTDTLGTEWQLIRQETAGEFFIRQHLFLQLNDSDAEIASTGWGGDQFAVYWNEATDGIVVLFRGVWDTVTDAGEFAAAYPAYLTGTGRTNLGQQGDGGVCWQGGDVVCLYMLGAETVIVRAPTLEMVAMIAAAQLVNG